MLHDAGRAMRPPTAEPLHVLLVEDDDGDAFLVEELLAEADLHPDLTRAWSLEAALDALAVPVDCVLLDLGLPDASGLDALVRLREASDAALVVLTGLDDAERGVQAVAAGAQDYLVKGTVDGELLGRAVRYAVERRRADRERSTHEVTRTRVERTARLERSLLAAPHLPGGGVRVTVRYDPPGEAVLGNDLYDVVQRPDGTVAALLGHVPGTGPDAAALAASLRISWRALVLAGLPPREVLRGVGVVLRADGGAATATAVMSELDPARRRARVYLAGHPAPLVVGPRVSAVGSAGPSLGEARGAPWQPAEVDLGAEERLVLLSAGLAGPGRDGGAPGVADLAQALSGLATSDDEALADAVVAVARQRGWPDGGAALLVLGWAAPA